jgi:putative glutamine amidotransferase
VSQQRSPIIGITTYSRNEAGEFNLPGAYVDAVQLSGGVPLLIPPNQTDPTPLLDVLDGVIFSGGGDIDPSHYGGEHHPTIYLVDGDRDEFELKLAKQLLSAEIPVLGICRGMQVLNVATGGTLITHVPDVFGEHVTHRFDHPRRPTQHDVQIAPDSRLATILGTESTVVSWHHQAVKTIDPNWQVMAQAEDGLVEAMEFKAHPWMMAVQWHPEMSPLDSEQIRLFKALVEAASDPAQSKI